MIRTLLLGFVSVVALARGLAAQGTPSAEYAARRDSFTARVDSGVVIAFGAPDPVSIERWSQLPAFRYLTGFLEPNAALVLVKQGGAASGTLFTAARDPRRALYDGFPPDSATVARETGLAVRSLPTLGPMVDSLVALGLPVYDLRDYATWDAAAQDSLTRGARFIADLVARQPGRGLQVRDAHPRLDSLRAIKTPAELAQLRRAINITVGSLKQAIRSAKPGMWEYELEALIEGGFRRAGADGPSFGSIIGSGPNSTQYHYEKNDRRMQAGDVVVMDVGAAYRGYAADVTRTIPVEARGLARLGLIESPDATFDPPWSEQCRTRPASCTQAFLYMAHGLGHGIGLEVHDPPHPWMGTGTFEVGNVFTIEPGIYVSTKLLDMLPDTPKNRAMIAKVRPAVERYQNIGIRIEDDYLITPNGVEWLSRAPREVNELEALRLVSSRAR